MSNVREIPQPIYDGWKLTQFSETVLAPISGRRPKGGASSESGTIPSVGGEHITNGGILDFSNTKFIPEDYFERIKFSKLEIGDILICKDGALAGKVAFYEKNYFHQAAVNEHIFILRPKNGNSAKFLFFSLQSEHGQNQIKRILTGSAQPGLTKNFIDYYFLNLPSPLEQRKIAAILSSVDAAIEQTDAIISQTERMKKSLMQELLTKGIGHKAYRDTPIGRIPIEWDVMTCDSVCEEIVVGIVVKPSQYYSSSGVPALRSANIRESGIDPSNLVFITEESNRMLAKSMVRSGNVLTVRTGYPGTSCVVPPEFDGCNCIDIIISRPKPEIISSFLSTWINSDFGKKQVLRVQSGLAQQHFNIGELKKMLIAKPSVEEQQRIMSIINVHDLRLFLEDSYLSKLKQLKRGLMQDLFSGKVPVKVDGHA